MKSSRHLTNLALATVVVMMPAYAFADKNDDLYARGQAAMAKGDPIAAKDAFCAIDPSYKDAKSLCDTNTSEATAKINLHNKRYLDALQAIQDGKLDEAEKLLQQVKLGPRVANVPTQLQRIADLRQKKAQADAAANAAAANSARVDQGVQAFNRGDFGTAKANLPPGHELLGRIAQYESKMAEGQRAAASRDYANALVAYGQAAAIAGNGPGDPNGQIRSVQAAMSSASAGSNPPPTQNTRAAVKDEVKKVDVSATLAAAQKAFSKKEYGRARILAGQVLATDRGNAEAKQILADLPEEAVSASSVSEEDPLLAAAIQQFYQANYSDAADSLKFYIFQKGKKQGLARFYLGATLATQYYLNGEQNQDADKLQDAKKKFKEAKAVQGFNPPAKFVSPKIMRLYESAS